MIKLFRKIFGKKEAKNKYTKESISEIQYWWNSLPLYHRFLINKIINKECAICAFEYINSPMPADLAGELKMAEDWFKHTTAKKLSAQYGFTSKTKDVFKSYWGVASGREKLLIYRNRAK